MPGVPSAAQQLAATRPRVQSVARAVAIVLEVAKSDSGLRPKEISERLGLGRQATYHLLHTLVATGMLTRDEDNRYILGLRVATLAEAFDRQLAPAEHLAPLVRTLARDSGETAYAVGWWAGEITTLTAARGTNPVQAGEMPHGYAGNAHARAAGKLLLAYASDELRGSYLESHALTELTDWTITDRAELERAFDEIRSRGYAVDDQEFAEGLCCIAVPFDGGLSPFVLALSTPRDRFHENLDAYLELMLRLAASAPADAGAAEE